MNNRLSVQSQLSIGISVFKDLRELNQIYVDKTDLIYDLAKDYAFYFLSRPRRFGKSLLISTIESLFRDGTKYFKGLAIADKWQDENYPVIHLDFPPADCLRILPNLDVALRICFFLHVTMQDLFSPK